MRRNRIALVIAGLAAGVAAVLVPAGATADSSGNLQTVFTSPVNLTCSSASDTGVLQDDVAITVTKWHAQASGATVSGPGITGSQLVTTEGSTVTAYEAGDTLACQADSFTLTYTVNQVGRSETDTDVITIVPTCPPSPASCSL